MPKTEFPLKALRYTPEGNFQVIDEPRQITEAVNDDYPGGLIHKLNYVVEWQIGPFDNTQTSARAYVKEDPWTAIVILSDYDRCRHIFVDDMGLLMRLRIELAALCANESAINADHDAQMAIEKAFRAWHGHAVDISCRSCDPQGVAAQERAKQARKAQAKPKLKAVKPPRKRDSN